MKTYCETFVLNLPKPTDSEECAHSTDFSTRGRITSKINTFKLDTGQQSGVVE